MLDRLTLDPLRLTTDAKSGEPATESVTNYATLHLLIALAMKFNCTPVAVKINYRSLLSAQSGALPARLTCEASPSTTPSLVASTHSGIT